MSKQSLIKKWRHFIGVKEDVWPILRLVGHLENMSRRDVFSYLKGHVERHFPEHINEHAVVALKRYQNGWLYELCLGGDGRSRLDGIASFLEQASDEDRLLLPAGHRFGEVSKTERGTVVFRLLPEANHSYYADIAPGKRASALYPTFNGALLAGGSTLLIGASALALALSLAVNHDAMARSQAMDEMHRTMAATAAAQYHNIPAQHLSDDDVRREAGLHEYIRALKFDGKNWTTSLGCVGALCESEESGDE